MIPLIMIIDDEEGIRSALYEFLHDVDAFRLKTAHSAEDALEQLLVERADLCIVDMRLPGMNGKDFILASSSAGLSRHYIILTGFLENILTEELESLGITPKDVFVKPTSCATLLERIRTLTA